MINGQLVTEERTLRDEFAMAALTGLLACPESQGTWKEFADFAYEQADAMMTVKFSPFITQPLDDQAKEEG